MNIVNLTSAGALDAVEATASSFLAHELATKQSSIYFGDDYCPNWSIICGPLLIWK